MLHRILRSNTRSVNAVFTSRRLSNVSSDDQFVKRKDGVKARVIDGKKLSNKVFWALQ